MQIKPISIWKVLHKVTCFEAQRNLEMATYLYFLEITILEFWKKKSTHSILDKFNLHNWDGDFLLSYRIMMIYSVELQNKIRN